MKRVKTLINVFFNTEKLILKDFKNALGLSDPLSSTVHLRVNNKPLVMSIELQSKVAKI